MQCDHNFNDVSEEGRTVCLQCGLELDDGNYKHLAENEESAVGEGAQSAGRPLAGSACEMIREVCSRLYIDEGVAELACELYTHCARKAMPPPLREEQREFTKIHRREESCMLCVYYSLMLFGVGRPISSFSGNEEEKKIRKLAAATTNLFSYATNVFERSRKTHSVPQRYNWRIGMLECMDEEIGGGDISFPARNYAQHIASRLNIPYWLTEQSMQLCDYLEGEIESSASSVKPQALAGASLYTLCRQARKLISLPAALKPRFIRLGEISAASGGISSTTISRVTSAIDHAGIVLQRTPIFPDGSHTLSTAVMRKPREKKGRGGKVSRRGRERERDATFSLVERTANPRAFQKTTPLSHQKPGKQDGSSADQGGRAEEDRP